MARVQVTEQANNELEAIVEYYERIGATDFALVFEENIIEKIRPLERFPRMGRIVPEIGDEMIREVLYRTFRIVYIVDREDEDVKILTIFHASRPLGAIGSGGV